MNVKKLAKSALVITIYIVLTVLNPVGYGMIQFRISEALSMLPFKEKDYRLPLILAVAVANFKSEMGLIDVFVGVLISVISYYIVMPFVKNIYLNGIIFSVLCGIFVGLELKIVLNLPFFLSVISVFASQLIITMIGAFLVEKLDAVVEL